MKVCKVVVLLLLSLMHVPVFGEEDTCADGFCQCVRYVKECGWWDFGGLAYAKNWFDAAAGKGYTTGKTPIVGAVRVWTGWSRKNEVGEEVGNRLHFDHLEQFGSRIIPAEQGGGDGFLPLR